MIDKIIVSEVDQNENDDQYSNEELDEYQVVFEDHLIKRDLKNKPKKPGCQIHWMIIVLILLLIIIIYEYGGGFRSPVKMSAVDDLVASIPVDFESSFIDQQQWARELDMFDTKLSRNNTKSFEDEAELKVVYENNTPDREGETGLGVRQVVFTVREGELVWVDIKTEGVGNNTSWEFPSIGTINETPEYLAVLKLGLPHSHKRGPSIIQYQNVLTDSWTKGEYLNWIIRYFSLLYESQLTYNCKSNNDKYIYKLRLIFHNGYLSEMKIGRIPENEMNLH